jgi:bile acid:Na+ symporter, BASS family
MNRLRRLSKNRDVILVLGLLTGLAAGHWAEYTRHATIPVLALVMALSTLSVTSRHLNDPRRIAESALWGLFMNYFALSGFILLVTTLVPLEPAIRDGFVIIAIVPPAVAIIPFSDFLDADRPFSLLALFGAYLGALVLMPLVAVAHWGTDFVNPWQLMVLMAELIVAPVVVSRIFLSLGWEKHIEPVKGALTNWCFFIVVYSMVGLNRHFLLNNPLELLPVVAMAAASTFGLGLTIIGLGRLRKVRPDRLLSLVLLGTLKNYGLAGGLALAIFDTSTALPAVVSTTFMVIYIIWLNLIRHWVHPRAGKTA